METSEYKQRKRRLAEWDYSRNGYYFVTFCTANRRPYLGSITSADADLAVTAVFHPSRIGEICETAITEVAALFEGAVIDRFAIMPNHVHLLIKVDEDGTGQTSSELVAKSMKTIPQMVARIKSMVTKGARSESLEFRVWQESYHDHIVRNEVELNRIREYIEKNPLKWALDKFYVE